MYNHSESMHAHPARKSKVWREKQTTHRQSCAFVAPVRADLVGPAGSLAADSIGSLDDVLEGGTTLQAQTSHAFAWMLAGTLGDHSRPWADLDVNRGDKMGAMLPKIEAMKMRCPQRPASHEECATFCAWKIMCVGLHAVFVVLVRYYASTWPMMLATLGLLLYSSGLRPESWKALSMAMYAYLALPPMKRRVSEGIEQEHSPDQKAEREDEV
jgi:hypothetical protein